MKKNRQLSVSIPISLVRVMDKLIEEFNKKNPEEPTNRSEFITNAVAELIRHLMPQEINTEKAD